MDRQSDAVTSRPEAFHVEWEITKGDTSEIQADLGAAGHYELLLFYTSKISAGSAANYAPALGSAPSFSADTGTQIIAITSLVSTLSQAAVPGQPIQFYTPDGKIFLNPNYDSGSDNEAEAVAEIRWLAGHLVQATDA